MQNSPQEIKSRLDRAVDPEGNVLDMAAVLELVTTLERLPITREALEATRIGKTINLLRKKTSNEILAKRAKKLVKKWQKLVINQIEATRNVDSPINGSRISSPQINGALSESDKSSTPTLTDTGIKSISFNDYKKRGLKRKRSSSSSGNSPLTLVETPTQDKIRPETPTDISSDFQSIVPSNGSSKNELLQSRESSPSSAIHKNPKLVEVKDKLFEDKDGMSLHKPEYPATKPITNSGNLENNNIGKDNVPSEILEDVNIFVNSDEKDDWITDHSKKRKYNVKGCDQNSDKSNFSNVNDNECTNSDERNVYTGQIEGPNHSILNNNNTSSAVTGMTEGARREQGKNGMELKGLETCANSQKLNEVDSDNNRLDCSEGQEESNMCNATRENLDIEHHIETKTLSPSTEDYQQSSTSNELSITGNTVNQCQEISSKESENLADVLEPKELILDVNKEANGINGRYNDSGNWYSWTDIMPYNDGTLNILPYVILE